MSWEAIANEWKELRDKVKKEWGWLTSDDLERARCRRDQTDEGNLQDNAGPNDDSND